jgi:hypothetical protein
MANPIALTMITLGIALVVLGFFLVVRQQKAVGVVILLFGLATAMFPFLASFGLAR